MRIQRFFKQLPSATNGSILVQVLHTRLHCDGISCDSSLEWEGNEKYAEAKIHLHGWTIGRTGIVRCSACTKHYAHYVFEAVKQLSGRLA